MAAFEVIALDTATPQLRAPGASDTYTFPRAVEMPLGTANGVLYLNGSKVVTSGSALTFDGTNLGAPAEVYRTSDTSFLRLSGGNGPGTGANVLMFGSTHATNPNRLSLNAPNATATSYIDFGVAGSEQMRLTSTGLGIGTSSPAARVHAYSGTSMAQITADGAGAIKTGINFASGGNTYCQIYFDNNAPYDMSVVQQYITGSLIFGTNSTERARITSTGNVVAGGSVALATTATDGFLYVPTCAGTPTGTPTAITGMAPIVVNTTNNKLYFYSGGQWRDAGP